MTCRNTWFRGAALLLTVAAMAACGTEETTADQEDFLSAKPPQFVMLAFDGSLSLSFWQESRDFAKAAAARGAPLKFTYFASGVYFTPESSKRSYIAPAGKGPGRSDIGFGGTTGAVALRYGQLNAAASEGHEIASHGNGHFDGTRWTADDWSSEFDQFNTLMFETPRDGVPASTAHSPDVVGYRAPLLGQNAALYQMLPTLGFRYDTSKTARPNYWPEKIGDVWNFPLGELNMSGSGRRVLSMDYNFYVAHSRGLPDPANKAKYKQQMLDTYRGYFTSNYVGNRAPIHIGHHFSRWNGGAYWEAMQEFALEVCGQPNVRCGTYKDLLAFMDGLSPEQLADYRRQAFSPAAAIAPIVDPASGFGEIKVHDDAAAHDEPQEALSEAELIYMAKSVPQALARTNE